MAAWYKSHNGIGYKSPELKTLLPSRCFAGWGRLGRVTCSWKNRRYIPRERTSSKAKEKRV